MLTRHPAGVELAPHGIAGGRSRARRGFNGRSMLVHDAPTLPCSRSSRAIPRSAHGGHRRRSPMSSSFSPGRRQLPDGDERYSPMAGSCQSSVGLVVRGDVRGRLSAGMHRLALPHQFGYNRHTKRTEVDMAQRPGSQWRVHGKLHCDYLCPAIFTNPQGRRRRMRHCTAPDGLPHRPRHHGDVSLDGLKIRVWSFRSSRSCRTATGFRCVVDEKANDAQRQAWPASQRQIRRPRRR